MNRLIEDRPPHGRGPLGVTEEQVSPSELITRDGVRHELRCQSGVSSLSQALVTNYSMRPAQRFRPLAAQHGLLDALAQPSADGRARGRIGVDFGSVSLCHVAAGFTDATVEFAKGFAIWDLAPGHYILHAAGGSTLDLTGRTLPLNYGLDSLPATTTAMTRRQRFIAATNPHLANTLVAALAQNIPTTESWWAHQETPYGL